MAEQKPSEIANEQSENAWGYFVVFWKYFFILSILSLIFLAIIGT